MPRQPPPLDGSARARYEFRVWGRHRTARKELARLATATTREAVDDCYLVTDDSDWNVKIRGSTLKLKRLVAEDRGFEHWVAGRFTSAEETPEPFDELFEALRLDRRDLTDTAKLRKAIDQLDPALGVRAIFVHKERTRYEIGELRAEATDIDVIDTGETVRTLVVEGTDLDQLVKLRKKLGLRGEPNVAAHIYLDED